ncbi:MAG: cation transporter [Acidobacteria bacterium]|nr:cation transporter [Acidobacteriota bacterium]
MGGCGCEDSSAVDALMTRQRGTLRVVLGINAVMFVVIAAAALHARSSALLADSLDNLGDALTYALSLWAVARGARVKAKVALFKGALILVAALVVIARVAWSLFVPLTPVFEVMGAFSLAGLLANSVCLYLLRRHRREDINMSSVWECSRNDIASNLSVFAASGGIWLTGSAWPDTVVALGLTLLLVRSSLRVIGGAIRELRSE